MIPPAQAEIAALLAARAGRAPIETHISAVFVGAHDAWKLRKAVRLPFLDFTDAAARRAAAYREVALNAPHAPGLYHGVLPVRRSADGRLDLGGPDDAAAIDWVVHMARVPAGDFLDAVAAGGGLSDRRLDALGDAVSAYLAAAPVSGMDGITAQRDLTEGNVRSALAAGLPKDRVDAWHRLMNAELARRSDWLRARGASGFVRRCHGDLHLGNLCLWHDRPVAFDALEFDDTLATGDVAYDLAFLLMDLEHRVGRPAANRVLNRYVGRTGDAALVAGLPLFMAQKAMVRAHVEAARRRRAEADAYLAMSIGYLRPDPPVVVAVGGLMGTGKTTLARALAPALGPAPGALVLRSDEARKRRAGVVPEQRLPDAAYTREESRAVFADLHRTVADAVAAGHAVVADAVYLDPEERADAARAADGAPFVGLWLEAPLDDLAARLRARQHDASDATPDVLHRAATIDPGPLDWQRLDARDAAAALAAARGTLNTALHRNNC
jgi:uncharacterized protein